MSLITIRNSVAVNQSTSWSKGNNQCKSIWVAWHELFPMFHVPFFARKAVISHGPAGFILWRLFSAMLLATGSVPFSCLFICLHHLVLFVLCCSTYSVLVITVWTSHQECMHTLNSSHRLYAHSEQLTQTICTLNSSHRLYAHSEQLTQTICTLNSSHRIHAHSDLNSSHRLYAHWTAHTDYMHTLNSSHRLHAHSEQLTQTICTLNSSHRLHAHSEQLTQTACSLWTTHTECTLWTAHTESMHNLNSSHRMHAQFEQLT